MLDIDFVVFSHERILQTEPGLPGFGASGIRGVQAAVDRVENHAQYAGLDDVFGIAAWYAVAISRSHAFNDANKRTALVCALAYLSQQGIDLPANKYLEDLMVQIVKHEIEQPEVADYFSTIVTVSQLQPLFEQLNDSLSKIGDSLRKPKEE